MCWSKLEWEQWQREHEREPREEPQLIEDEPREDVTVDEPEHERVLVEV